MNTKKILQLAIIACIPFLFNSCITDWFGVTGKGSLLTETRTATDFHSINLMTAANVDIVKGTAYKVEVQDYENLVKYISVKVVDHNLVISNDPIYTLLINSKAKVTVTMPDSLTAVTLTGAGDINLNSAFKDVNTMLLTGSGNIVANEPLNVSTLTASVLGSGNITASGTAQTMTGLISGSGNINFINLAVTNANCNITGSGNISVHAISTLKATITGAGNVFYTGSPTIDKTITGVGQVIHN